MCEVLWYNEGKILRNLVTPTPRGIYHEALSNPTEYLPCECCIKVQSHKSHKSQIAQITQISNLTKAPPWKCREFTYAVANR